jgi:hypothetical protein
VLSTVPRLTREHSLPRGGGTRANKKLSPWGRLEEPTGDV